MRRLIVLGTLLFGACQQQRGGEPVQRIDFGGDEKAAQAPLPSPTPTAPSACESVTFEDVPLTHCVADPAKHRINTALGPESGPPWRSLKSFSEAVVASQVVFAMNGGMFDGEGKPIGYYVEDSNRLKELNRNAGSGNFHLKPNGVFYGSGGRWQVRTSEDFYAKVGDRPQFGTQSGPMLVIAGKLHPEFTEDGPSRTIRNGVGVDAQGRAHFVISEGPVSFGKFARYFRDVLKTPNALYLDGSVSALWDPATGRIDGGAPIGPILVVTNKDTAP